MRETDNQGPEGDEVEVRISAKRLRDVLEAGLVEVLAIEGKVIGFKLLDDKAVITVRSETD